jgi:hypothetical protein
MSVRDGSRASENCRTNPFDVAALICGIIQFGVPLLASPRSSLVI